MIPQHYPVEEGKIYAGEYPGARSPEYAEARMKHLIGKGIRTFVDLTAPADDMEPYDDLLIRLGAESGFSLRRISMPIRDMGIPRSTETMQAIMDAIRGSNEVATAVYIHCWGGIGRTGTVVGCWLRECGHDAEARWSWCRPFIRGTWRRCATIPNRRRPASSGVMFATGSLGIEKADPVRDPPLVNEEAG